MRQVLVKKIVQHTRSVGHVRSTYRKVGAPLTVSTVCASSSRTRKRTSTLVSRPILRRRERIGYRAIGVRIGTLCYFRSFATILISVIPLVGINRET